MAAFLIRKVCGTTQASGLNFLLGVAIGLVIAFMIASFGTLYSSHLVVTREQHTRLRYIIENQQQGHPSEISEDVSKQEKEYHEQMHKEMDKNPGKVKEINFDDAHVHKDNSKVADELKKKVRVLCWIMTGPQNLETKAIHVKKTWGKRCNILLFFSSVTDKSFPTVGLNVEEGREHLTAKTRQAFKYVYENYFNDADWFMKADDDTYVIVENLRYFLSSYNSNDPVFFGHHFKTIVKQGYYSGGAGYVLSKEALRRLIEVEKDPTRCRDDGGAEDAVMGKCMELLGVRTANSTDSLGRSRFHCFNPETHLFGGYPDWYYKYDANGAKKGQDTVSDYAVSFHYVRPQLMYALEFYVYHLRPYGIESGHQHLNMEHRR